MKNYVINIKCPGTTYSNIKNQCNVSVKITDIIIPKVSLLETELSIMFCLWSSYYNVLCVNESCYAVKNTFDMNDKLHCGTCDTEWCKKCLCSPYHDGQTCIEYENVSANTDISRYVLEKISIQEMKYCPGCKVPIEKTKNEHGKFVSCNKMVCENCGIKWCWLCEQKNIDYDHNNEKNNTPCSNHLWKDVDLDHEVALPLNNVVRPVLERQAGFNLNILGNDLFNV
jgi:hypothetical protein